MSERRSVSTPEQEKRRTVTLNDKPTKTSTPPRNALHLRPYSQEKWKIAEKRASRLCGDLDLALGRELERRKSKKSKSEQEGGALSDDDSEAIEEDEDEDEESGAKKQAPRQCQGPIIDFLKRLRGPQVKETIAFTRSLKAAGKKGAKPEISGFTQALDQVQLEALTSELMEHITSFWKSGGAKTGGWTRCGISTLKNMGLQLLQYKRQVACLESEVHNWLLKFRLLHRAAHERDENADERRRRLQSFWSEFHTTSRKMEVSQGVSLKIGSKPKKSRHPAKAWAPDVMAEISLDTDSFSPTGRGQSSRGNRLVRTPQSTSLPSLHSSGTRGSSSQKATRSVLTSMGSTQQEPTMEIPTFSWVGSMRSAADNMKRSRSTNRSNSQADVTSVTSLPPIAGPESPTKRYLAVCQYNGLVPQSMPFVTGHSLKLNGGSKALVDTDLLAVAAMIPNMSRIEEVDLTGNGMLSEKAMVPFMQHLLRNPALQSMERFSIKGCRQFGYQTLDGVVKMLSLKEVGARNLLKLDLSGISIAMKSFLPLCKAIRAHQHLKSVFLADVGLGRCIQAKRCIGEILSCTSMRQLDLGWNSFDSEVFEHLGERLVETERLQSLCISNCSVAHNTNYDIPIVYFLEYLMQNKTLTYLDISLNRIDYRGALVVEDALEHHKKLLELDICYNPLGTTGMRSILRLLCRDHSSLMHFLNDGCSTGTCSDSEIDDLQIFSVTNPGGRYRLDLTRPYHRTLLRMLYKTTERFGLTADQTFENLSFSPGSYAHASKDIDGWQVQNTGNLAVTFSIEKGMEKALKGVNDTDYALMLERHSEMMRLRPGFKKVVPLFAQWRTIEGRSQDQVVMLDALSKDFLISFPQMQQLSKSRALVSDIITRLLHCVTGGVPARYLTMLLTPSLGEYVRNQKKLWTLLGFNVENPTGHYRLNLSLNSDHGVAESLMLLDRWEVSVDRKLGRVDVSQKGNLSHLRNEKYQDRELLYGSIAEWNMPDCDVLEFDYVSSKRPPADAAPLDKATFDALLSTLFQHNLSPADDIEVFRLISHNIYFMALQLRELLGQFRHDCDRLEIFMVFFMRVMDMCNEKVFRVRFNNVEDLDVLRDRLGWATFFPFIQPEQAHFHLDFAKNDERMAAGIILGLMGKERRTNLRNPEYIHPDGTHDPLTMGVPKAWETVERIPRSGTFICDYGCAPEDRCFALRKQNMLRYGAWDTAAQEQDVMWWAALTEAPLDVLEYLEFLVARYDGMRAAFKAIDGEDGNGVLTLREFEASVYEMKCKKFEGPDEKKRIESVFRYLDPSGEGEVSAGEFMVLEFMWREMHLSISEFVSFLERNFASEGDKEEGGKDFLEESWNYLDDDGSGEITEEEWTEAIQAKLHYFGPCKVIFSFIDKDDEGTVSLDEFMELRQFSSESLSAKEAEAEAEAEKESE
mmetsp:Transcript_16862/g.31366  ORF Transcript_16862/g.31366 Transcript_16862/m.31366 type:complete len:1427 (-) Transcript_16862:243-4523(-)